MAVPVIANPSVADRHNSNWWAAPIGVGVVNSNPVYLSDLPNADPHIAGQLWLNLTGNVVTESIG